MTGNEVSSHGEILSANVNRAKRSARLQIIAEEMGRSWYRLKQSKLSLIGLGMVGCVVFVAIFASYLAPYPNDVAATHFENRLSPPSQQHWLGTDNIGRDILSRVLFGSRVALMVGILVLVIAISVGVPLGLIAGYFGGWINQAIMRVSDVFLSIPQLVLAIAVCAALGPNLWNAIVAVSFVWWPWYTRLVQGEVISLKEREFVEAARAIGSSKIRIAFNEILPNVVSPITVKASLDIGFAILVGAALSFLALGSQEPTPDWGLMLSIGRKLLPTYWWLTAFPGFAIFFTVLAFNLLGDGLRDAFEED
jgi:peptide/nickel transport system permease protein